MMVELIPSQNELFEGQMIPKPPRAVMLLDAYGEPQMICPHCRKATTTDDCDVCGAEPECLFCGECGREFEIPEVA